MAPWVFTRIALIVLPSPVSQWSEDNADIQMHVLPSEVVPGFNNGVGGSVIRYGPEQDLPAPEQISVSPLSCPDPLVKGAALDSCLCECLKVASFEAVHTLSFSPDLYNFTFWQF